MYRLGCPPSKVVVANEGLVQNPPLKFAIMPGDDYLLERVTNPMYHL